ncbi:MAG: Spy/CpxP family protein refolding chaperone [Thermodesulfobacteriota bacterium]
MKKLILTVLAITILATSGLAFAQGWGRGAGMGYGPGAWIAAGPYASGYFPGAWAVNLNLTAEQLQKMQALREAFWKEITPWQNELFSKRLELRSLWLQPNPDQNKILAKQREINALIEKIQEKTTKHRLEMRQILTPEQQAKLGAAFGWFGPGAGFGRKGGFGLGRGMGYGPCFW